jgi:hypothetical protein
MTGHRKAPGLGIQKTLNMSRPESGIHGEITVEINCHDHFKKNKKRDQGLQVSLGFTKFQIQKQGDHKDHLKRQLHNDMIMEIKGMQKFIMMTI